MLFLLGSVLLIVGVLFVVAKNEGIGIPVVILAVILGLVSLIKVIPAGKVGVIDVFGKVKPVALKQGLRLVNPFAKVPKMSIKTQETAQSISTLSKEGLKIDLDFSILYRMNPEVAPVLYQTIGKSYQKVILIPQVRSVGREVTALYDAKALYAEAREELSVKIREGLIKAVKDRGLIIEDILLRKVGLPPKIKQNIEDKVAAEQQAQKMQFILQKEVQEAERKKVEARGIAGAQAIIRKTLTPSYLQYLAIQNYEKIAASNNTTFVIVPTSTRGTGMPLILNASSGSGK